MIERLSKFILSARSLVYIEIVQQSNHRILHDQSDYVKLAFGARVARVNS